MSKGLKYSIPKQFLGAFKKGHRFSSRSMVDEEISWTLLERIINSNWKDQEALQALTYLTKFNNEFHKNAVSKEDPLHTCGCPDRKKGDKHLAGCLRNELNDRENTKNRDVMSVQNQTIKPTLKYKHSGESESEVGDNFNYASSKYAPSTNHVEDAIIDYIDSKEDEE